MSILDAKDVYYSYQTKLGRVTAVNGISCAFESSNFYSIMGASGSGKTTFLSLLAGLDIPDVGTVLFQGQSLSEIDRDNYRRKHVSVIYQNFNLFFHLSAIENAAYPLYLNHVKKTDADAEAETALYKVGILKEQLRKKPGMLSGGEQQRVAIARALTSGAEIILADEPTGNLDKYNSENIVQIFNKLAHEENRCVIVVTHDPAVAEKADVILHMQDGKLL